MLNYLLHHETSLVNTMFAQHCGEISLEHTLCVLLQVTQLLCTSYILGHCVFMQVVVVSASTQQGYSTSTADSTY